LRPLEVLMIRRSRAVTSNPIYRHFRLAKELAQSFSKQQLIPWAGRSSR
jgi:hypothetical protein